MPCSYSPTIEIGRANEYVISDLAYDGLESATCTVETPSNQPLPTGAQLAIIVGTGGTRGIFRGLYYDQDQTYEDNGNTRKYSIKLESMLPLAQEEQIDGYPEVSRTIPQHVAALIVAANAGAAGSPTALYSLDYSVKAKEPDSGEDISVDPDIDLLPFGFDEQLYLSEALDRLAAKAGYSWEIVPHEWLSIEALDSGAIATVVFRKNNVAAVPAPKPVMNLSPGASTCNQWWQGSVKLQRKDPRYSRVVFYGKNGRQATLDNQPAVTETIERGIPAGVQKLDFEYRQDATFLTQVELITV